MATKDWKKRATLESRIVEYQRSVIHHISKTEGETRGYYQLLENEKVTENDLIYGIQRQCIENITDQRVLVFDDSCTINLEKSNNRLVKKEGLYNIRQNQHQIGSQNMCDIFGQYFLYTDDVPEPLELLKLVFWEK